MTTPRYYCAAIDGEQIDADGGAGDERPSSDPPTPLHTLPLVTGLAVAEFMSSVGSTMAVLGIAFLSYNTSRSVVHTVLVSACYSLPTAFLGMYAGRLSTRTSRRRILLATYCFKPCLYAVMAVLAAKGVLGVGLLMVFSLIAGAATAFGTPAWMEFERDVVPHDRLDEVNGLFGGVSSVAAVVGAAAGGLLMAAIGVWTMFAVDALSFSGLIYMLWRARPAESIEAPKEPVHLGEALTYIRRKVTLRRTFVHLALLSLLVAPSVQLLPAIASALGDSRANLGVLTAAIGVGSAGVAWLIKRLRARYGRRIIVVTSMLASAVILAVLGSLGYPLRPPPLWLVVLASLIPLGLLITLVQSVLAATVQVRVDDPDMDGPIFAAYAIVYTIVAPIGGLALAQLADHFTVWTALIAAGIGMSVPSMIAIRRLWTLSGASELDAPDQVDHGHCHRLRLHTLLRGHLVHLFAPNCGRPQRAASPTTATRR